MKIAGIEFPSPLLSALRDGRLVVFAGAGVSMGEPANLPDFNELALKIASGTGESFRDRESEDRFLGRLQHKKVDIYSRTVQVLSCDHLKTTELHLNLLRLFSDIKQVRIVTTNFDLLFEQAAKDVFGQDPEVYRAPALPLGRNFNGIIHIHGVVTHPYEMVLTDADFGRAYLTEGWSRRFLVDLFRYYTVMFIGYSHNDTIMNYLSRALPESETGRRFVLTEENNNPKQWDVLGIMPITFPKPCSGDFGVLYKGVQHLADIARRSVLDWQREITTLAEKLPPLAEEDIGMVEDALTDVIRTRFFVNAARLPEWIIWLDKRKQFELLFSNTQLGEKYQVLARWLSEHFAFNYTNDLMLLIAAHEMHLNPQFWSILGREVALKTTDSIENTVIARWISFLLSTVPPIIDDHVLLWLGQLCIERVMISSLVQIFDNLSESRLRITEGILWPDMGEDQRNRVDADLHLIGDHYALNELWQKGLKPSLAQIADYLLDIVVKHLEKQHFILRTWQKATPEWDSISLRRTAIEPHEQDQYPESVDVLIDAARDCLEWLALNQKRLAAQWCDRQIGSEVPLLRRLAVHTLSLRTDLSNEEKLGWLLTHIDLHQISVHHEIFQAVKLCYPMASQNHRVAFIKAVLAYQCPDSNMDHEKQTEWSHFQWLHWIHNAAPDCLLAKKALADIQMRNPDLRSREYPDLTHSVSVEWVGLQSPWTAEELLAKPASKWLPKLLSFEPVGLRGPNREGLATTIAEATKWQPRWGLELAEALAEIKEWSSDIWTALIRAWGEANLTEHEYCEILGWLNNVDLYRIHNRVIANVLHMFVENDGKPYVRKFLSETNKIALVLWTHIEPQAQLGENDDWLTRAINHPSGILTRYWIESLSVWRKQFDPRPDKLSDEYDRVLTTIVKERSLLGRLGRTVLTSQFAFFLGVDEVWTRENLIPLFDFDNGVDDFNASWDGFLTWSHLSPNVAHILEEVFLKAIQRIENLHERDRFIEFYTAMIVYHVSEPLPLWIPELFRYTDRNLWYLFALKVRKYLQGMNEINQKDCWKRWLKEYWENRIQGVPAKLENDEIARMIEWLPSLQFVFDEAVELAINMSPANLQRCSVIYYLSESNLLELHPESVGKLLIYLGKCESPRYNWGKAREIIKKLSHIGIPSVLENELQELLVKLDLL